MNFQTVEKELYSIVSSHVDKLNASNAPELKSVLIAINKKSINNIIIDLSNTSYCDSSGLTAILTANRLCKDSNGKFILVGLQKNVSKMISIAQLDRVFTILDSLETAEEQIIIKDLS
ncbi:MAG: STAS domain-containing protein [Lishizhenia sp.]